MANIPTNRNAIERELYNYLDHFRYRGWVRRWEIIDRAELDAIELRVEATSGRWYAYRFTRHELAMGGLDSFRYWMEMIEREIRRDFERENPYHRERIRVESYYGIGHIRPEFFGWDLSYETDKEAEKKAKELFKLAAGNKAFKILDSGNPLSIIGSEKGDYLLFKRASYCIERPSDGAKLCAVVPGVPLWDHLLGIKLMVEHDEPLFLKTANVSGVRSRGGVVDYNNFYA